MIDERVKWIADSGHEWLQVPKTLLKDEQVKRISTFSYESYLYYYLEGDSDAEIYLETIDRKYWSDIRCTHHDVWHGRAYKRVNS